MLIYHGQRALGEPIQWPWSVAKVTDDVLHQANLKTCQMKAQFCDERTYLNAGKETFH